MKPSRAMITGELSWAFVALCYAWAGSGWWPAHERGALYSLLLQRGESPALWSLLLGVPAIALIVLDLREWSCHKYTHYDPRRPVVIGWLEASAVWRGRFCLALIFGWFYMVKAIVVGLAALNAALFISIGGCFFAGWFYVENRRVRRQIRKLAGSQHAQSHQGAAH